MCAPKKEHALYSFFDLLNLLKLEGLQVSNPVSSDGSWMVIRMFVYEAKLGRTYCKHSSQQPLKIMWNWLKQVSNPWYALFSIFIPYREIHVLSFDDEIQSDK